MEYVENNFSIWFICTGKINATFTCIFSEFNIHSWIIHYTRSWKNQMQTVFVEGGAICQAFNTKFFVVAAHGVRSFIPLMNYINWFPLLQSTHARRARLFFCGALKKNHSNQYRYSDSVLRWQLFICACLQFQSTSIKLVHCFWKGPEIFLS